MRRSLVAVLIVVATSAAAAPAADAAAPSAVCRAAFPSAGAGTSGRTTRYNRQQSVKMVVCDGFGAKDPHRVRLSVGLACEIVAEAAGWGARRRSLREGVTLFTGGACSAAEVAAHPTAANHVAAACGFAADVLGLVATQAAGALGKFGCKVAEMGGYALGHTLETRHQRNIARDVIRRGKCITLTRRLGHWWRSAACAPGDRGFATLPRPAASSAPPAAPPPSAPAPQPPPAPPSGANPRLAISGSCTSAGGTLTGSSSGFTPGGTATIRAWYPDGRPYTDIISSSRVNPSGQITWNWPCAGDPPGTYSTEAIDDPSGRSTGRVAFTIGSAPAPARRVLVVDNRVTNGMGMREDSTPTRLSTQPWIRCVSRGCAIYGTERWSGGTYDAAVCQRFGERTTNGHDTDPADDSNPGRFESTRYYGVRLGDGTFGYVSEVWIRADHRGGLGLPAC